MLIIKFGLIPSELAGLFRPIILVLADSLFVMWARIRLDAALILSYKY